MQSAKPIEPGCQALVIKPGCDVGIVYVGYRGPEILKHEDHTVTMEEQPIWEVDRPIRWTGKHIPIIIDIPYCPEKYLIRIDDDDNHSLFEQEQRERQSEHSPSTVQTTPVGATEAPYSDDNEKPRATPPYTIKTP